MADPFDDSRRLTGGNVYFAGTGAALEAAADPPPDAAALARWQANIATARKALDWSDGVLVAWPHRSGASLAFVAPADQLYAATEVNEWAWRAAVDAGDAWHAPGHAAAWDAGAALRTLGALAAAEASPALVSLRDAASRRGLPLLADDDVVSIGAGSGHASWPAGDLPRPADIDWPALHAIPTVLVTGSNGKTTTVRLVAAMMRTHGWRTAHSCTDGVFFDGAALESGDFSGPTGARTALRQPGAQAAVLETARGGLLRRGLALGRADVAVVTNVSPDHFGEYGVHDLDDLARVKLTVARALDARGTLVLNADDPVLVRKARGLGIRIAWFALDFDGATLGACRGQAVATCGVRDGRLHLLAHGIAYDLGDVASMPLSLGGRAPYNVANIAAAALAAVSAGVAPMAVASTLARFGATHEDNPGRLQHWRFGRLQAYVDYAHNPDGLRGFLRAIDAGERDARLGILLGHAGNREDADLREVATTAAAFRPDLVVLKDIGGYERGRAAGEVASIMAGALRDAGVPAEAIVVELAEVDAARRALAWAHDGDLLALPVHELDARAAVVALLDTLHALDWRPGDALPPAPGTNE